MNDSAPTVAVLGTGTLGLPMARHVARAGMATRAWNRTTERARPLEDDGVRVHDDPGEAVAGADVVVTILSDADAVLDTAERALPAGDGPAVWAQMSTLGLEGTERCAVLAQERGVALVDAPVLGTKQPAEAGELIVLAAGPDEAVTRCAPVFEAVGRRVVRLGEAGEATRLKLVLNHWILGIVENVAETIRLAEGLGVDPALWLETIGGGPLDLPYAQLKGKAILDRALESSFRLALARKDAGLVLEAAARHDVDAALMQVVADRMGRAIDAGHGDDDMAATYFG
jgi:3-hydroxyisobutyrate dehydrogenase